MGILAGLLGCLFAVLGIFTVGFVFVPLAAICTGAGLIRSIAGRNIAGFGTSLIAGLLTTIGFAVSPSLWLLAGGILAASQTHNHTIPTTMERAETPLISPSSSGTTSLATAQPSAPDADNASPASQGVAPTIKSATNQRSDGSPTTVIEPTPRQEATNNVTSSAELTDSEAGTQPSFDCSRALTRIERTICSHPELALSDGRMGLAFKRRYAQMAEDQRFSLLTSQRQWIALRKSQCNAPDQFSFEQCIERLTKARIATLEGSDPALPVTYDTDAPPRVANVHMLPEVAASDGQELCRGKGTIDAVRPIPKSLVTFANILYGEDSAAMTVYRCINGFVYVCQTGNGFSCDRPNTDPYNLEVERYCQSNPDNPFVPMAVSGHGTIYTWKCIGKHAAIGSVEKLDERGFRADMWTALPGVN